LNRLGFADISLGLLTLKTAALWKLESKLTRQVFARDCSSTDSVAPGQGAALEDQLLEMLEMLEKPDSSGQHWGQGLI